jgi:integrase
MSVRKRKWTTSKGEVKTAWVVVYSDSDGGRHMETFKQKKAADARAQQVGVDIRAGIHTPASKSPTVAQAADDWIAHVESEGRERTTVVQYRQHAKHINKRIGHQRLASLTTPGIAKLRDELLRDLGRKMARKLLVSLKSILREAQRRGNVAQNVALNVSVGVDKRGEQDKEIGVHIPSADDIKHIIAAADGRTRPWLLTAIFTGLRASELRGLQWQHIDLKQGVLHVRQRADRYNALGKPKSKAGTRTIPLGPDLVAELRAWKLACPHGPFVFPTRKGELGRHINMVRAFRRVVVAAGLTDAHGKPKYSGLHSLRHFYASWCINRKADGGLELPVKLVQARLGHATLAMTMDTYGHLFPSQDDGSELATAQRALMPRPA